MIYIQQSGVSLSGWVLMDGVLAIPTLNMRGRVPHGTFYESHVTRASHSYRGFSCYGPGEAAPPLPPAPAGEKMSNCF